MIYAKSSFSLLTGVSKLIGSETVLSKILLAKTSNSPFPGCPFDEKYKILSSLIKGNISRSTVLIFGPKFLGSL